eukprot:5985317-Pyramimonas_sp.AAC.1
MEFGAQVLLHPSLYPPDATLIGQVVQRWHQWEAEIRQKNLVNRLDRLPRARQDLSALPMELRKPRKQYRPHESAATAGARPSARLSRVLGFSVGLAVTPPLLSPLGAAIGGIPIQTCDLQLCLNVEALYGSTAGTPAENEARDLSILSLAVEGADKADTFEGATAAAAAAAYEAALLTTVCADGWVRARVVRTRLFHHFVWKLAVSRRPADAGQGAGNPVPGLIVNLADVMADMPLEVVCQVFGLDHKLGVDRLLERIRRGDTVRP